MLLPKIGCVPAHPANVHRLLYDEGSSCSSSRGPQGHREALQGPLPAAPLRPRRLRRGGDARARADRARRGRRRRGGRADLRPRRRCSADRALYFPITPTFPHFGLLGMLGYLPAKFTIRFLAPSDRRLGDEPWEDKALVQTVADEVRATIQDERLDMVGHAQSVWFG
jgi:hypothetical protein